MEGPKRLFLDAHSSVYRVASKRLKDDNIEYLRADLSPKPVVPDGCLGYWSGFDPRDFDCEYEFAGHISCEDCIFGVCGGKKDPRVNPDKE